MEKQNPPCDGVYRYNKNTGSLEVAMYGQWTEALHDTSYDVVLPTPDLFDGYPDFHVFTLIELQQLVAQAKLIRTGFRTRQLPGRKGSGFEVDEDRKGMPSIYDLALYQKRHLADTGDLGLAGEAGSSNSSPAPVSNSAKVSREEIDLLLTDIDELQPLKPKIHPGLLWTAIAVAVLVFIIVLFVLQAKKEQADHVDPATISTVPEYTDPPQKL